MGQTQTRLKDGSYRAAALTTLLAKERTCEVLEKGASAWNTH